jgi:competence protein CoiA
LCKGDDDLLVALLKNGSSISLLDDWRMEQLDLLRRKETFICPICKNEVVLKLGRKRITHFAHRREAACTIEHETESSYHLSGKADLFKWLKRQRLEVKLEPYLQSIQQRPDLLLSYKGKTYAIEYQCSTISEELFRKRTASFLKAGIKPLWILGANRFHRSSTSSFRLSTFQWLFAYPALPQSYLLILYYCPKTKQFFRLVPLASFSVYNTFSTVMIDSAERLSFEKLFQIDDISLPSMFWHEWFMQKKRWRLMFPFYPTKENRLVCMYFYKHNIVPALFPSEAGLPIKYGYLFETPSFIWQTYILIMMMKKQKNGMFHFSDIYSSISQMVRTRKLKVRNLPFHYFRAINEYLLLLVQLGYIKIVNSTTFRLIKPVTIPKTIEEALKMDHKLLKIIEKRGFIL